MASCTANKTAHPPKSCKAPELLSQRVYNRESLFVDRKKMMKTAAKKRKRIENRMDIRTYFDKENFPPEIVCSPPKKKPKAVPGLKVSCSECAIVVYPPSSVALLTSLHVHGRLRNKTETCLPLGPRDANGCGSLIKPRYHRLPSMDSSVKEERMTGQQGLKQDQEVQQSPEEIPPSTETVEKHFPKTYKTRSPTNKRERWQSLPGGVSDVVSESGRGGPEAVGPRSCESQSQEISEAPHVNRWVERRFPGSCKLEHLRNEDFHLQEKWRSVCEDIGRSACKIVVHQVSQGTGFVLIDRIILTTAHLFRGCLDGNKLRDNISVSVIFELETRKISYSVEKILFDVDEQLDYAVLVLRPEGERANQPSTLDIEVPPGLLRRFGPVPENGEVCIIGHPAGEEKTFENTFIIEAENRKIAVKDYLAQYKDQIFTKKSIKQIIANQGINEMMMGGMKAKLVITYHSSMYEGASGSPVIDGHAGVIGLHTGGYGYGFPEITNSVMEFARALLTIYKTFLENLKKNGNKQLLERIRLEAPENIYLKMLNVQGWTEPIGEQSKIKTAELQEIWRSCF
ncbi:hypothetical protein CRENBAI_014115 [Crenichthys baileyi]|uniref:Protein FAM111A n=1 Tax=Crenichthys baileyi TaxID=28760 RepID=A0AAV9RCX2_9TELE